MFVDGSWYRLSSRRIPVGGSDPIEHLPITILTRQVIEPLFGIADQRTDKRIDFVGGGRGLEELERRVNCGRYGGGLCALPDADARPDGGRRRRKIMPPKSTWFEPKLADGMVSHVLD